MNRMLALVIPLALASCAPMMSAADPAALATPDALFAQAATGSNLFEIQSSQLALTHSSSAPVRAFAQQMIADHTNAQTQLAALATAQQLPLPSTLPPDKQLKVLALGALNGAEFDAAYVKEQTLAHQLALSVLQNELSAGANTDLKGYATAQVPVVTAHLTTVTALTP